MIMFGQGGFVAEFIDEAFKVVNKAVWNAYWERLDMQVNALIFGVEC